ncbi:unnamed protein product [Didymodactylos carnosus]|uniref:Uncharacterized protein n=1 Tax=Didymodactylos carnosus TaxID=1234261 RepID=A0A8S2VMU9_9BILA|nr:unnamed protein product [Didymodactylos carnosus]CAF4380229.1 unnamed protein product [Didymodactylos carnosus]
MTYTVSKTQFNVTTSIQKIIEQLMTEEWNDHAEFGDYYSQCNPDKCVYTYNKQGDIGYMVTTIIGLIDGLTTVLKILIPPGVVFLKRKKRPAADDGEYLFRIQNH